ncbi:MAG TPA: 3'(2'),5'-bisphosphate nucleotidase CysQ [Longimicrobiales bacterium]
MGRSMWEQDLALAFRAAYHAGAAVMKWFGAEHEVIEKAPDQPLTPADLEADRILRERLLGARPGYGWLSEETVDRPGQRAAERVWIVDPIDGTRSFIAGRPEFTISIGLAERGDAVVGVVYNPATREVYWAVRGGGACAGSLESADGPRTATRLAVSARSTEDQAVMLASRSEVAAGEFDPFHGGWRLRPTGSTAYKLAKLAAGEGDVFLSRGPKSEWDVCAGALLVEEAGGRVTDLDGRPLRYNRPDPYVHGVLASNGRLHDYVLGVVRTLPPPPRLRRPADPVHPGLEEGR